MKKEFDSKPVYNKKILKTKTKSHGHEVTDFYNKEIPKVDSNYTCLAGISLDSALKKMRISILKCFLKSIDTFRKNLLEILLMT